MAVVVASGSAVSVSANSKSSDRVSGQYQFTGPGVFTLIAKASATGMNAQCSVGGVALVADEAIPFTGTAGTLDVTANVVATQVLEGGKCELFFRNTTAGAITVDYILYWNPM